MLLLAPPPLQLLKVLPEDGEHESLDTIRQDPGAEATAQDAGDAFLGDHQHHSLPGRRGQEEGGRTVATCSLLARGRSAGWSWSL